MSDVPISDADQSGYEVGYCKPPKATRWPKGKSANPAGKKKGDKSLAALFRKVGNKMVPKKVGDKVKMVSLMEMLIEASIVHGAKGNTNFGSWLLKVLEEFGTEAANDNPKRKSGQIYRDARGIPKIDFPTGWNEETLKRDQALLTEIEKEFELMFAAER